MASKYLYPRAMREMAAWYILYHSGCSSNERDIQYATGKGCENLTSVSAHRRRRENKVKPSLTDKRFDAAVEILTRKKE